MHKSKAVTRWPQGAINIVVNSEKEGFAHSFNITHGTSVCAIGLRVDDAAADARPRAEAARPAVPPGRRPRASWKSRRCAALGGSLLYFIDPKSELGRVWDIEFEPTGEDAAKADAGLTAVDHISQSMHYEEMLTWLLFYTSLLDVEKTPRARRDRSRRPRAEPGRRSRPTAALRIILNASQSRAHACRRAS